MSYADEFHHGYGGFSVSVPTDIPHSQYAALTLDPYRLWGESIKWDNNDFRFTVTLLTVVKESSSVVVAGDRNIVIERSKANLLSELKASKALFNESPFIFNKFRGVEVHVTSPRPSITRMFFVNSSLYILSLSTDDLSELNEHKSILDSFRLLNKNERIIAMIEQHSPPRLSSKRPVGVFLSDATQLGLKGGVKRIRDIEVTRTENAVIQEVHFDKEGFTLKEVGFNSGYPDVVISWGWFANSRVNIQSAINYPFGEGPQGSRKNFVSGPVTPFPAIFGDDKAIPKYGNRFETEFDDENRPIERKRYAYNGALIAVESFRYGSNSRGVSTTDDAGGFIGRTNERLDAQDNVIELQVLSSTGSVVDTTFYEYRFDGKGNWIERTAFKTRPFGKQGSKRKGVVHYRDIQYYESEDIKGIASLTSY